MTDNIRRISAPQELTDREIVLRLACDVMGWESRMARSGNIYASARMPNSFPALDYLIWGNDTDAPQWNPLESHDAVAEVLAKLPEDRQILVGKLLGAAGRLSSKSPQMCCYAALTATPRQKCIALLKALG